jgi:hypothetical protein
MTVPFLPQRISGKGYLVCFQRIGVGHRFRLEIGKWKRSPAGDVIIPDVLF